MSRFGGFGGGIRKISDSFGGEEGDINYCRMAGKMMSNDSERSTDSSSRQAEGGEQCGAHFAIDAFACFGRHQHSPS
jgi:hypothetical protein